MSKYTLKTSDFFYILRAVAMVFIFLFHADIILNKKSISTLPLPYFYSLSYASVWIFFILSGYFIAKGFYENKYKTDFRSILLFYKERAFKIIIPYYLGVFVYFFYFDIEIKTLFRLLTFSYTGQEGFVGIQPFWFVSTIVQFYVIAPFIYTFLLRQKRSVFFVVFVLILGTLNRVFQSIERVPYQEVYVSLFSNIDLLFASIFIVQRNNADNLFKKILRPISVCALGLLFLSTTPLQNSFIWYFQFIYPSLYLIVLLFLLYAFDVCSTQEASKHTKIFYPIVFLGKISYPFYIFQLFFLVLGATFLRLSPISVGGICFITTILWSSIYSTFHLKIESKFICHD